MSIFHGLSAFPITPTDLSGVVDTDALRRFLIPLAEASVDSIGLLGSTGGYVYLSREQRRRAIETASALVGGKIPLIVGIGALRTDDAQALAHDAKTAGADGLLLAPVSYTQLTEDEVFEHFVAVTEAGQLPLCIYNNPSTTKFSFSADLIARLAKIANVEAVKMPLPASGDALSELSALRAVTPKGFSIGYSGDWGAPDTLLAGADAWYSVIAGLLPGETRALAEAARAGDVTTTLRLNASFEPMWSLFKEFGSFRVMYAIAEALGLGRFALPRPVLSVPTSALPRVDAALNRIKGNS